MTLDEEITEQIEKLAFQAGKRAAARHVLAHGDTATVDDLTLVETAERDAVAARLTLNFQTLGKLDELAGLPNLNTVERVSPPVITVLRCPGCSFTELS
jgi:hypothetical protein